MNCNRSLYVLRARVKERKGERERTTTGRGESCRGETDAWQKVTTGGGADGERDCKESLEGLIGKARGEN